MNIHEYQAKALLSEYGLPIARGALISSPYEIDTVIDNLDANVYAIKAQIHAGGRAKAGGVKIAPNKSVAKEAARQMLGSTLVTAQTSSKGQEVRKIYVEEGVEIAAEYYLALVIDRDSSKLSFVFSKEGGVDIEAVAKSNPSQIHKLIIDPVTHVEPFHCRNIAYAFALDKPQTAQLVKILQSLYKAFLAKDATQIEINPLVVTKNGDLLLLDAKINIDDNALFRHPYFYELKDEDEEDPLELEAERAGLSYIKMDGDIGCMVNGAGLAMATMDIIKLYGGSPANFLDVGGGADQEKVTSALKIILADPKVRAVLVNIFGGIMRCDIIAQGIINAVREVGKIPPLVVRLAGTNYELGNSMLLEAGLDIIPANNLGDAAAKVVAVIKD